MSAGGSTGHPAQGEHTQGQPVHGIVACTEPVCKMPDMLRDGLKRRSASAKARRISRRYFKGYHWECEMYNVTVKHGLN